jgi:hypothetical protein
MTNLVVFHEVLPFVGTNSRSANHGLNLATENRNHGILLKAMDLSHSHDETVVAVGDDEHESNDAHNHEGLVLSDVNINGVGYKRGS